MFIFLQSHISFFAEMINVCIADSMSSVTFFKLTFVVCKYWQNEKLFKTFCDSSRKVMKNVHTLKKICFALQLHCNLSLIHFVDFIWKVKELVLQDEILVSFEVFSFFWFCYPVIDRVANVMQQ
jgi:hypothetical protein